MKKHFTKKKNRKNLNSEKVSNGIYNKSRLMLILIILPLSFAALFQGGYFPWEVYAILLLFIPAIFLFFLTVIENKELKISGADKGIAAFILVAFVSLFFTVYFHATLTEFYKLLIYAFVFYAAVNFANRETDLNFVLNAVVLIGLTLSILGFVAFIGSKFHIQNGAVAFLIDKGFVQGSRISSSLQYANTFAAFLVLPFFISFSYMIRSEKMYLKTLYGIFSLIFIATLMFTESRGGLLTLLVSWIIFLLMLKGREKKEGLIYTGIVLAVVLVIAAIGKSLFLPMLNRLVKRFDTLITFLKGQKSLSLSSRESMIKDSFKILKAHPVLGTGNGTYQYVYAKYRSVYFFSRFPHSIFFQVLDELGIAGGAAFIYMLYSIIKRGVNSISRKNNALYVGLFAGLMGILFHAFIDFDWSLMFMPLLFFFGVGLLISRGAQKEVKIPLKKTEINRSGKILAKNYRIAGLVTLTIVIFTLFAFPFFGAVNDFRAKASEGRVSADKTIALYRSATNMDPLCAEYHYDLAHFYFVKLTPGVINPSEFLLKAEKQYKAAIQHCPEYFLYHFELAKLYLQMNNKKAIDEFAKTVELNPIDPGAHASLGFAYLKLSDDTVMAKVQFEEALKLDPKNSDAHLGMGMLFEKLGDDDNAIKEYSLAVKYNRKSAYAYYRLGMLEEKKNNIPMAVRYLFYAVQYNPNLSEAKKEFEKYGTVITVIKPSPNEVVHTGKEYKIMWLSSKPENVSYYNIWLFPKKGGSKLVKAGIKNDSSSYVWKVPDDLPQGVYRMRIYAINSSIMKDKKLGSWVSYGDSNYFIIKER